MWINSHLCYYGLVGGWIIYGVRGSFLSETQYFSDSFASSSSHSRSTGRKPRGDLQALPGSDTFALGGSSESSSFDSLDPTSSMRPSIVYTSSLREACNFVNQNDEITRKRLPLALRSHIPRQRLPRDDYTEVARRVCRQLSSQPIGKEDTLKESQRQDVLKEIQKDAPQGEIQKVDGKEPSKTEPLKEQLQEQKLEPTKVETKQATATKVVEESKVLVEVVEVVEERDVNGQLVKKYIEKRTQQ